MHKAIKGDNHSEKEKAEHFTPVQGLQLEGSCTADGMMPLEKDLSYSGTITDTQQN